ncbi:MAG: FCD domain-containing protein [Methylocystaceae bacterium]|nr:FCD domain-containing protein [Methylocystaceae bacterium]
MNNQALSIPNEPQKFGKTKIEHVYSSLRQDILNGKFEPGSKLRIEHIRESYGVSSSSVREALSRLLVENLVTTEGQRGFRVSRVSIEDFKEIAEMRKMLESRAVYESVIRGDDEWEANLVKASHKLAKIENLMNTDRQSSTDEWELRNNDFHDALIAGCNNKWLLNFRSTLYQNSIRYIRMCVEDKSSPRDVRQEHQAIFEAALERKAKLASTLIEDHIEKSVTDLMDRLNSILK